MKTRRIAFAGATLAGAALLSTAHARVVSLGSGYAGPWLVADHVYQIALLLAWLALCAGVGRFALARLGLRFERALEELSFATAAGTGVVATAILLAGSLGAFRPLALATLCLALAGAARREIAGLPALARRASRELGSEAGAAAVGALSLVALSLVLVALTPPVDWDALMYHLEIPARFLERGRLHLPEDNLHVAFVGLAHMAYVPLLAFGGPSAPALLSAASSLLLALAACAFAARFLGERVARGTLVLVWGSSLIWMVAVTPRVDVILAWLLFLAHYAIWIAAEPADERDRVRRLGLAGALLGFAFGVKYHAAAYALALAPVVLWVVWRRGWARPASTRALAALLGCGLVAALPWLIKNWALLGAPLYPLLAEQRVEPWIAEWSGPGGLPESLDPDRLRPIASARSPFNLLDLFRAPGRLSVEAEAVHHTVSWLFLVLPLWALRRRERAVNAMIGPALVYAALILLYSTWTNPRYLIPALAPLTIAAVWLALTAIERGLPRQVARPAFLVLTTLVLLPTVQTVVARWARARAPVYAAGTLSRDAFLSSHPDLEVSTYARALRHVNDSLPDGARILLLLEARAYYFERDVLQDNRITNWPFLVPLVGSGCLEGSRITHVLVSRAALAYYVSRGLDPAVLRWSDFDRFRERCLTRLYDRQGFTLYRLESG